VFGAVAFCGLQMTRVFFKPLGELEKEVDRLAKGDLDVKFSALNRSDEIGHIARSMATIQESLVELARLKAQRDAMLLRKSAIVTVVRDLWDAVRAELRNVKDLLASEGRMIAGCFRRETTKGASSRSIESAWQSWKAWLTDEPILPRTSTA
jgi:HAMP domain-containing protein